jgi:glutamyl-Q tRNA(Asp) synthetase
MKEPSGVIAPSINRAAPRVTRFAPFVTRFAPSPNGWLHLGHAYSALMGVQQAEAAGGRFLLRIEDIDIGRARPHFIDAIYQDLAWLGLEWPEPVLLQSTRFEAYEAALKILRDTDLVYPCWATRREILDAIPDPATWPRDPDGAPLYPGLYRDLPDSDRKRRMWEGTNYAWRLDMKKALAWVEKNISEPLTFQEHNLPGGPQTLNAEPAAYGDVVLARKDVPTSYHLAVVLDDAYQNITQVTRGQDLAPAAHIHRLLQALLGLPTPDYFHHALVRDTQGRRLSKQAGDNGVRELRQQGRSAQEVLALLPPPLGTGESL